MAVPKYDEFFPSFMKCLADGGVHTIQEIRAYCADYFNLSEGDRTEIPLKELFPFITMAWSARLAEELDEVLALLHLLFVNGIWDKYCIS